MVPCTTRRHQAFQCLVAVVACPISGVIGSVATVEMFFFCVIFHYGVCSTGIKLGRSENHSSRNVISKDVMLFVFVSYNGGMSPNDIISPDIISDIISDGMKPFGENLEKNFWKFFFEKTFWKILWKGPMGQNRNKQTIRSKPKGH